MRDSPVHGAERELGQRRSWLEGRTRGPRGQEVLLPASLEAEHWEDGGTGQNRVCPRDQAAQEAWAAVGHGRNTLRLEAKWVHPVLPKMVLTHQAGVHGCSRRWLWSCARGVCVPLVAQSCLTLCDPMDCSPPGSLVHGTLQARITEWVAMPSSRGSLRPRDRTQVSRIAGHPGNPHYRASVVVFLELLPG